jgi:hypothetical protein
LVSRTIFKNQPANILIGVHPFKNGVPSEESSLPALAASNGLKEFDRWSYTHAGSEGFRMSRGVGNLAMRAQDSNQPLGQNGFERRRHKVRLDSHIY